MWFIAALLLLLAALAFGLGLPAYAMYVLLGVMLVSRWLARHWIQNLSRVRECNRYSADVGDTVAVIITLRNAELAARGLGPGRGLAAAPGFELSAAQPAGSGQAHAVGHARQPTAGTRCFTS